MKKILLSALLSAFVLGNVFAQIRFQTDAVIGQTLKNLNTLDKDTFTLHFQSSKTACSAWAHAKAIANLGKDSVVKVTCMTQKGIQVKAFLDNVTTTAYEDGSFKCNNAGGNGNPGRFASIDSLKSYLQKSIVTGTINGSTNDSLSRPAAGLFNYGNGEIAFGMYPGKATKIEYIYRFDYTSKACTDDISFDMWTYDAGTTGKTATYELAVYKSSVADANLIGSKVNIYTTGDPKKTINLAASIGVAPSDLSNKSLYVVVKTLGTNANALPNAVDANNLPVVVDPTIVFDNFFMTYATASWSVPAGVIASAVFNHNNGSPVYVGQSSTDFSGGTPVSVAAATNSPVYVYLTGTNRIGSLDITEANDGGGHSAAYSFAATGAVKKKAIDGSFSIDVPYTYTPSDGITKMDLLIAAPTSGSVNDTLQVAVTVNTPLNQIRTVRLEITNGIRFWYNISAIGDLGTGVQTSKESKVNIFVSNRSVFANGTVENVLVTNVAGQRVLVASPAKAAEGIALKSGIYIVKTGSTVQKVIVK